MTLVLSDADLSRIPTMQIALAAIEEALAARSASEWVSPPRHHVSFGDKGDLVFTVGGTTGAASIAGFRAYETFAGSMGDQIIAVWSTETARLLGIVTGSRLGAVRTGAIGGIAIRHMSAPGANTVGIIGSGHQARTQLEAAAIVRKLDHVRVYSRNETNRRAFATEMSRRLSIAIEPVESPRQAVREADIVICATTSPVPVIEAGWLKPGVHINSIGPKTLDQHELGLDVAAVAHIIATDSPEQARAYKNPFFLLELLNTGRMIDLAAIVSGDLPARPTRDQTTLFCSVGLAGTEVLVASKLLSAYGKRDATAV
jgi:ornithine cyclodeaminase